MVTQKSTRALRYIEYNILPSSVADYSLQIFDVEVNYTPQTADYD